MSSYIIRLVNVAVRRYRDRGRRIPLDLLVRIASYGVYLEAE